ncbi:DUF4440 domain-containing protein [uncultured Erythrobacter sp.]|uniref:DUF4440 domain-containing protein n=1 Tax=uncultured Erythrobacter sp. TaxID=263913 RepID=UPI00262A4919|nr:DUF4440 domain-containing protein [uncultured Erythrobacter sp.]
MFSAIALMLAQAAPATEPPPIPSIEDARVQIAELDSRLFWAAFEGCEPDELGGILAEDFRMLHDLGGLAVPSRDAFLASIAQQCADREPDGANPGYKNRRLLVPGSRTVTPLGEWGVLERAHHTFHEWRGGDKGWEQVGGARYIHVWQWIAEEGRFRLAESLSIDHGAAEPYPPAKRD